MGAPSIQNLITDRNALKTLLGATTTYINDIPVDVLRTENQSRTALLSTHPIDTGNAVTDNRHIDPNMITLECTITDDLSDIGISSFGIQGWRQKYPKIIELWKRNEVIEVQTELDFYPSVMIQDLNIDRTASTADALIFRITLKETELVSSATEDVDPSQIPKRKRKKKKKANKEKDKQTSPKKDKGKQQTKDPSEKDSSFLNDWIFG